MAVTLILVALNLAVYALERASGGQGLCDAYGLVPARFTASGDLGPIFTSMFLHDPSGFSHLTGNLIFLVFFGFVVEREIGGFRFLILYVVAGLGGAVMHVLIDPSSAVSMVGASGAICGLIAFSVAINRRLVGFALAFGAVNIWYALTGNGGAISFGTHIGGLFVGTVVALFANLVVEKERFA